MKELQIQGGENTIFGCLKICLNVKVGLHQGGVLYMSIQLSSYVDMVEILC